MLPTLAGNGSAGEPTSNVIRESGRRNIAVFWSEGHRLEADRFQFRRDIRNDLSRSGKTAVTNIQDDLGNTLSAKRRPTDQDVVQRRP